MLHRGSLSSPRTARTGVETAQGPSRVQASTTGSTTRVGAEGDERQRPGSSAQGRGGRPAGDRQPASPEQTGDPALQLSPARVVAVAVSSLRAFGAPAVGRYGREPAVLGRRRRPHLVPPSDKSRPPRSDAGCRAVLSIREFGKKNDYRLWGRLTVPPSFGTCHHLPRRFGGRTVRPPAVTVVRLCADLRGCGGNDLEIEGEKVGRPRPLMGGPCRTVAGPPMTTRSTSRSAAASTWSHRRRIPARAGEAGVHGGQVRRLGTNAERGRPLAIRPLRRRASPARG